MKRPIFFLGLWLCFLPLLLAETARQIQVKGLQRIDESFVLSRLPFEKGDDVGPKKIDEALLSLYETGLFEDVRIDIKAGVVAVQVKENPVLNRVAFEGNRKVKDDLLKKEIGLKPRQSYTAQAISEAVEKIRAIYRAKGYAAARVAPKKIQKERGRIDLVFEISEGKPQRIKSIAFQGNQVFSDGDLRSVIMTKESAWYRFFSSFDSYDPDRLMYDRELLVRHYRNAGYLDATVTGVMAELTKDKSAFYITFQIEEGACYRFSAVAVTSQVPGLDLEDSESLLPKVGERVNVASLRKIADDIGRTVYQKGFFAQIQTDLKPDGDTSKATLVFRAVPQKPVFLSDVKVQGNLATNDNVIRREALLSDGDPVSSYQIEQTRKRLYNLDYFKKNDVHLEDAPGEEHLRRLLIDVEDKPTGQFMFSGGYSTSEGPLLEIRTGESNFLGRGQDLELNLRLAKRAQSAVLGFSEPYMFGKKIEGGANLFVENVWHDTRSKEGFHILNDADAGYSAFNVGLGLRAGYHIRPDLFQRGRYSIKRERFRNKKVKSVFYESMSKDWVSSLGHDLIFDRRNNVVAPTAGGYVSLNTDFAGVGGTVRYLSNQIVWGYYLSLDEQEDYILRFRLLYAIMSRVGKTIRTMDHMFMGGSSVRGFDEAGIGPRDKETDDAIGGLQRFVGNIELSTPLGPNEIGLKGFVFNDWGSLWQSEGAKGPYADRVQGNGFSLRGSVGVGLRWVSPFGLIGFSLGWPLKRLKGVDRKQVFRLNFGTDF